MKAPRAQDPLFKTLGEMYRHYAPFIDQFLELKRRDANSRNLVGDTSDNTLLRVYSREGYLEALDDIINDLKAST